MICEDDITFKNINLFNNDLKHIIENAPMFDFLLLSKICYQKLDDLYTDYNNSKFKSYIYGAGCYIISRNCINIFKDIINNNIKTGIDIIGESDHYLYDNKKTYVYKYNFIDIINNNDSTIHLDHHSVHVRSSENGLNYILEDFI
jgi:GR25 family glycosyltransferase involved in LPS biosynthesis